MPVAGAPGWYVVHRTTPVVSGYPMRWLRHFRLMAVAITMGLVVLVLSMVRLHWSEELTRAPGPVAADTKLRDEVWVLEEGNARLSAEVAQASASQSELESARRLDDMRIDALAAALDAGHRESARLDKEHVRLRRQNTQLNQSVTRARAAQEAARAHKELAARTEVESIKPTETGLEQQIAAPHLNSKLPTEAARQEAAPPRTPEAQRDPDQPAAAVPAPSATPQQPAAEPANDANAGQHPGSATSVAMVVPMPLSGTSPGAEAAAPSMLRPNAPIEQLGRPQDTLATLQAKPDPVLPDEFALLPFESLEVLERLTAERASRPRPAADGPSMTRVQPAMVASPSRAQKSRTVQIQPSRSWPQVGADPATLGSAAKLHVAGESSTLDNRSALPAGDIRVFIHHIANHQGYATLAQQLADYLRSQSFTVADIRPVDFSIGKPSVRYFFERDRAASQGLVEELGRFFEGGKALTPDYASDFTHFLPKPRPGNVEVWLPAS